VVVHLACNLLPEQSDISTRALHENICSLENILYLSLISRVGKVVVLMDWQIYGQYENQNRKTERSELKPETETGRQELLRDKLCEAYRRQGLDVAVLRIGLVYGPSKTMCPDPQSLQHQALPVSAEIPGFGYDFIHINDLTEAIIRVCQLPTSPVINLGSGQLASMEQFKRIYESSVVGKLSLSENCSLNEKQCLHNIQCTQKTSRDELGEFTCSCGLDYSLASFELDWSPRYTLESGLVLIKNSSQKESINCSTLEAAVAITPGKKSPGTTTSKLTSSPSRKSTNKQTTKRINKQTTKQTSKPTSKPAKLTINPAIVRTSITLLSWLCVTILNYITMYRLGLELDLLLPWIIAIAALSGSREGYFAAGLAMTARLGFYLVFDDIGLPRFVSTITGPLVIGFYFLLALLVCRFADRSQSKQLELRQEIENLRQEKNYLEDLYRSSLKVKENLQSTIAETQESFSQLQYIIHQFNEADPSDFGTIAVRVVAQMLRTPSVSLYHADQDVSAALYSRSSVLPRDLKISDYDFIQDSLKRHSTIINSEFKKDQPLVCAPVEDNTRKTTALLLLDDIDLLQLNQHYLNTLNSLVQLIGSYLRPPQTVLYSDDRRSSEVLHASRTSGTRPVSEIRHISKIG
jgi:nucleoside-diphosphate-sugar epimerase